jgi:excisionase family DNA binding protein
MKQERLTVSQAAKLRGVSRTAIYSAIARQSLSAHLDLGRWVVMKKDLLAWDAAKNRGRKKGRAISVEHRANISAAQKARWAKRKQNEE